MKILIIQEIVLHHHQIVLTLDCSARKSLNNNRPLSRTVRKLSQEQAETFKLINMHVNQLGHKLMERLSALLVVLIGSWATIHLFSIQPVLIL